MDLQKEIRSLRSEHQTVQKEYDELNNEIKRTNDKDLKVALNQRLAAQANLLAAIQNRLATIQNEIFNRQQIAAKSMQPPSKKPKASRCSVIGKTPSGATSVEVKKSTTTLSLHCHWLAMKLYDMFNMNFEDKTEIAVTLDTFEDKILESSLCRMVDTYQRIARSHVNKGGTETYEAVLTAQIAREFDRYLFKDNDEFGLYHQLPYYGQGDRADGMVMPIEGGTVQIAKTVFVYDFKPSDLQHAKRESISYISRILNKTEGRVFPVYIALFPTCFQITFAFVLNLPGLIGIAEIVEVDVNDTVAMKKLFVCLHAGINYLARFPILYDDPMIEPQHGLPIPTANTLCRAVPDNYSIFYHDEHVFKLFDTQSCYKHNLEVLEMVGYFEDLSVTDLSDSGRFQCLTYKYLRGGHCPTMYISCKMFMDVAKVLKLLHGADLVHGDIRPANIIFDSERDTGYIIDFDLTDKVGTRYPPGYNHIHERHPRAQNNLKREFVHDIYSLCCIIKDCLDIVFDVETADELVAKLELEC